MNTQFAVAPQAPGALGEDVEPQALLAYLGALGQWRDRRRAELDELDEASLHSPERNALTGDVLLSMALWKAVSDRHDLLVATWDSGRVLEPERRRMSTLIWGRLETGAQSGSALAVSLPEACRLSDSLAASLRGRLRLEGSEPDVDNRVRDLRATVERIRDQIALVPSGAREGVRGVYDALLARTEDVAARAKRGADVGGLLPALEQDAATAERDLIVGAARRTEAKADAVRARQLREELGARAHAVAQLAARALAEVRPAPRLGVPDPDALGDPPSDPTGVRQYLLRLDQVGRALDQCQAAYAGALERRDELTGQTQAYAARAEAVSQQLPALREDLAELGRRIAAARAERPVDLVRLAALVAAQQGYVAAAEQNPSRRSAKGAHP